jgi:hypothetical protein
MKWKQVVENYIFLIVLENFAIVIDNPLKNVLIELELSAQRNESLLEFGFGHPMFGRIHSVFKALFFKCYPISGNRINDLTYRFWCIQSYEAHSRTFKKANILTQPISKLLFLIRLVVLMECHLDNSHSIKLMDSRK